MGAKEYRIDASGAPSVGVEGVVGRRIERAGAEGNDERWVWFELSAMLDDASRVPKVGGMVGENGARAVIWSGSYAEVEFGSAERFEADPRTWSATGWAKLDAFCELLASAGAACVFRTHARHVLSDVPGCAKFLQTWGERGFGVLIDPVSMLTPEMEASAMRADLLTRIDEGADALAERFGGAVGVLRGGV